MLSLPRPARRLRILEPPRVLAREIDDQQIGPAIAVYVIGEVAKAVTVIVRIVLLRLFDDRVHLPVGRGKIDESGRDIVAAIVIEVADRGSFAAELAIDLRPLEADLGSLFGRRPLLANKPQASAPYSKPANAIPPRIKSPRRYENFRTKSPTIGGIAAPRRAPASLTCRHGRR